MKKIILSVMAVLAVCLGISAETMKVASYNLRLKTAKDDHAGNGWAVRSPYLADLVRYHDFEIFGTQEGLESQLEDMERLLPEYAYIGVGRDDGKKDGEHSAIFYRKDLFEPVENGTFWLSETPDKPSKGWDAACKRICTWGIFRDKRTGFEFLFMNVHFDHKGKVARAESSKMLLKKIEEIRAGKNGEIGEDIPVILTGDFNIDQLNEAYRLLDDSEALDDSYKKAKIVYAPNGTYNGFKTDSHTDSRIDHIFVSPEFEVGRYGILTDTYRTSKKKNLKNDDQYPEEVKLETWTPRVPSDHFPVSVTLDYAPVKKD